MIETVDRAVVPALPDHYAHLAHEPELAEAWRQEVRLRQAEAQKLSALLAYRSRKLQKLKGQHTFTRAAAEKAVVRDAAVILTAPESSVRRLLACAEFLQEKLPLTWDSWTEGTVDGDRVRRIAQAAEDIAHRDDILPILDQEVSRKAPAMNRAEIDQWVKRRVPELDARAYSTRCERARAKRYVMFTHQDDGMTKIDALVPTLSAAAVERQLWAGARARHDTSGDSERTFTQRLADEFVDHLKSAGREESGSAGGPSSGSGPERTQRQGPVKAKISILVPAETLLSGGEAPAVSEDRSFVLPADDARRIAQDPLIEHEWFAAGTQKSSLGEEQITSVVPLGTRYPFEGWDGASALERAVNMLATSSRSRFATGQLRKAILTRDGTCQADGCTRPAWASDVDHKTPPDKGGGTTPENTWVLCRDHHMMKSHGLLPIPGKDPPAIERQDR